MYTLVYYFAIVNQELRHYHSWLAGQYKPSQIWTNARDFGTYCISEQCKLKRVCAYAQTRQRRHCSHTQGMDAEKFRPLALLDTSASWFLLANMSKIQGLLKTILQLTRTQKLWQNPDLSVKLLGCGYGGISTRKLV